MAEFVHTLRVRYAECDMQGHAFNAQYFTWLDIAHTELWRATVGPYQELVAAGFEIVVAEASARFRSPARFDDEIDIAVAVEALSRSSMTTGHTIRRGGDLLAECSLRHVCVDARELRKTPWPDAVRSAFEPLLAAG
ncbi:acyl-CoA thioesterase [Conexibacter arvalis]|uniref:Acyl-CoA thioester hydrolase n=1 Tax=Conexibacter arvalis TaxID=912552 RepID=A0A840IIM3_9ACTN|nr:thioesterase family protein [Conexibacter arvalis]MBB4663874.1 acyl-CoA thioester hydrolase [Conexibacter arvalis]